MPIKACRVDSDSSGKAAVLGWGLLCGNCVD